MQHTHVMFFSPGAVSSGVLFEDTTDKDIFDMAMTAATIEEGNGNGKTKKRERPEMDGESRKKVRR